MPQPVSIPFYQNWTFWAVVIATIALILSQLPPLRELFRGARLDIEPFSRILLTHKVGNPNVGMHIIISNVGGKAVRIKAATIGLKCDGKEVASLPAQNYLSDPNDVKQVLFTSFRLKPKEDWIHMVNFLNFLSRENEKKYRGAESALKGNIEAKKAAALFIKPEHPSADEQFVRPFIEMHNASFIWRPGEYEMSISVDTVPKKVGIRKTYRFTLFESDSNILEKCKDDYKFGDGIYWLSERPKFVTVQIAEA